MLLMIKQIAEREGAAELFKGQGHLMDNVVCWVG